MEYRQLGRSGLRVSKLTMGTMTFGGSGNFRPVGSTDLDGARRQIDDGAGRRREPDRHRRHLLRGQR